MADVRDDVEKTFFERQLVVFKIGNEEFGVDISDVKEIIKLREVTKIPASESYVNGIINLRGGIIVIIDLAKKIRLPSSKETSSTRVIVTEIRGNTVGFVVDSCNEVLRLTGDKIEAAPKIITDKINAEYIQGVGVLDERLIILIDLGRIIEDQELENLNIQNEEGKNEPQANNESKGSKKILIIEDSTMMRGTLKSYIDKTKFNILEAEDGEKGLNIAEQEKPDVILLDIKLPKKDGVEVLKEIKEKNLGMAVIMETSVYEDKTKDECLKLGAKAYLKKPINKKELEDVLAQV